MLESVNFSFDGIKSVDKGIVNCQISGGMFEETFLPSSSIKQIRINGNDKPYFQRVEREQITFKLTFAFIGGYTQEKLVDVSKWFYQQHYKPFYTTDNPNRIFYIMATGDSTLIHTGRNEGYFEVEFTCDSPYSYRPVVTMKPVDFLEKSESIELDKKSFTEQDSINGLKIKDGKLSIELANATWNDFIDMKWSDLVEQ